MARIGETEVTIIAHTDSFSSGIERMLMVMFIMYIRELAFAKRCQEGWEKLQRLCEQIESVKTVADMTATELHELANDLEKSMEGGEQ